MTKLLYLARLREAFGSPGETLDLPRHVGTVEQLLAWLRARGEPWAGELAATRAVRVAVNHDLADARTPIAEGDEVAIFPPVTGG